MYQIPINVGLIDSLTIYLPLNEIEVIDKKLVSEFIPYFPDLYNENTEDQEYTDDQLLPPRPIMIQLGGINFRFNRVVFPPNKNSATPQELIRLTLTTKMLKERYFQGINLFNLSLIIEFVNSFNIIKFDLKTALSSQCNDIDICINYRLLFEPYKESCHLLKKMVKPSKQRDVSIYPRRPIESKDENFGLMFGSRDSGSVGTPFCKFYNKTDELLNHSTDFYNTYLFPQLKYGLDINNIVRKEITIRNSTFKRSLIKKGLVNPNNTLKTLKDILTLTETELTTICNVQLKYYFEKKTFRISSELSPTNKVIAYYMAKLVELGADENVLLEPLTLFDSKIKKEKVEKSRMKRLITDVSNVTFNSGYLQDLIEKNSIANEFIRLQDIF